jgi:DNA mismatch repair protein MutS
MDLNEIINKKDNLITENYFNMQLAAEAIYGKNTVIFLEIGSFYEIYQSDKIGVAKEICQILNIILTKKNKSIPEVSEKNPYLCGIPSVSLDKHLERLTQEKKWTIIIVNQEGTPPNISRKIEKIISPGTNIDYSMSSDYNYIASIFIEKNKDNILYAGLSMIDLSTGKVLSFENYGTKSDKELPIDEIIKIIHTNNCSEIVFSFLNIEDNYQEKLINSITRNEIIYTIKEENSLKKSLKINYQNEVLESVFNLNSFLSPIEELDLERTPEALTALIVLIEFIAEHNYKIINNLKKPQNLFNSQYLYLGNNALEQLNIVPTNGNKNDSLIFIINKAHSAIGKRFITDQLLNPIKDKEEIQKRYELSETFSSKELRLSLKKELKEIYDIERLWRKIQLNTITPAEFFTFYSSMKNLKKIKDILLENNEYCFYKIDFNKKELSFLTDYILNIEKLFDINLMQTFNFNNISKNFIKDIKKDSELFLCIENINSILTSIKDIGFYLSSLIDSSSELEEKQHNVFKIGSININFNESEGYFFEISNKKISTFNKENKKDFLTLIKEKYGELTIKSLKNSKKIYIKDIFNLSTNLNHYQNLLLKLNKDYFKSFIEETNLYFIDKLIKNIGYIEFFINNYSLKESFSYSKPEIIESENQLIEAIELRHPIIEQINQNEIFVPNNIAFGDINKLEHKEAFSEIYQDKESVNGILLYGLNSSGKSTLNKSIGISLILAQSGFFVPAKTFRFTLFESLFTRITGSDNIYKGLSTFAIEILELKNIFNRANEKTLILGDEIAHGTETISALSIVASAVNLLIERNSFFIFATHLHQLVELEEINNLTNLSNIHLSVHYDENIQTLVYNRKIKSGKGSSVYGLEFAKFMQIDKYFLEKAYSIRNKISNETENIESLTRKKRSRYNKDKLVTKCYFCNNIAEEEHHINAQRFANENGIIEHFHKNTKANLIDLCHDCHVKVESGKIKIKGYKQTGNGIKLIYS